MKPPKTPVQKVITFFYYHDLPAAMAFYETIMGLTLVVDQGWSKIYHIGGEAHIGLVDQKHGMHRAASEKPVQLCIQVEDVDAWFDYAQAKEMNGLSELFQNDDLGIRAFVFEDPEGYQIEIQSAMWSGR